MKTLIRSGLILMIAFTAFLAVLPAIMQDNTMSILSAIGALRAVQGDDIQTEIVMLYDDEISDDIQAATCWYFKTDKGDFCVRFADGSVYEPVIIPDPLTTPEVNATPEIVTTPEVTLSEGDTFTLTQLEEAILKAQTVYPSLTVTAVNLKQSRISGVLVWEIRFGLDRQVTVNVLTADIVNFGFVSALDNSDSPTPLTTPEVSSDNPTPLTTPEVSSGNDNEDDSSGRGRGGGNDNNGGGSDDD